MILPDSLLTYPGVAAAHSAEEGRLSDADIPPETSIHGDARKQQSEEKAVLNEIISIASLDTAEDCGLHDFGTDNPFPMDPDAPEEQQFTFRAVLVGCGLGAVISASKYVLQASVRFHNPSSCPLSVYLGLKTGWTFGASLFGSIFGFAILKSMSKALPEHLGGGYFGPKENVCCQSAATVRLRLRIRGCRTYRRRPTPHRQQDRLGCCSRPVFQRHISLDC